MRVAVITGGLDAEREVSMSSAKNIQEVLGLPNSDVFLYPDEIEKFLIQKDKFNIVIPVIHGAGGEDGSLQLLLDQENVRYIFSDPMQHAECFNKKNAKERLQGAQVLSPQTYSRDQLVQGSNVKYPIIAKPASGGSSVGLYIFNNQVDFLNTDIEEGYLFEQYISGREFTIGVVDTPEGVQVLPVMEAKKESQVFDFNQKYSDAAADIEIFPESLDPALEKNLHQIGLLIHEYFQLKDISRTDVIVNDLGDVYFLEVNTIPGMTKKSWIPKMLERDNISFRELLTYWINKKPE